MRPRDLSAHPTYEAGRGIEETARQLGVDPDSLIKLSSNENPLGPAPKAVEAIKAAAASANLYPKSSHTDLQAAIAKAWTLDSEQVWLANGGDGALDYLARAMLEPGDRVLIPDPGFAYYEMAARFHHGEVAEYPLERADGFEMSATKILESYDGERIVHVTTPHNPTGQTCSLETIETIAEETLPETLVVVDEAYGEFSPTESARRLLERRDDIAVIRTFSKAYGLAGVRLGYALTPSKWADAYARVNTPFAASEIACRAGLAALDGDHLNRTTELVRWGRSYLREHLEAKTWKSGGNFVLADVGDGTTVASEMEHEGVIVRDCSSFGLPACIRITVGTKEQTKQAVEVCNRVLASESRSSSQTEGPQP